MRGTWRCSARSTSGRAPTRISSTSSCAGESPSTNGEHSGARSSWSDCRARRRRPERAHVLGRPADGAPRLPPGRVPAAWGVLRRPAARRARRRDRRRHGRLRADLPLRASRRARRLARQDLARLRRRAVDRRACREQRDGLSRPARAARGGVGGRLLDLDPARPAAGGHARGRVVPVSALAQGERRVQACLRSRVGRLGRVLPRPERPAARRAPAGEPRELPVDCLPHRDSCDASAARLVDPLCDPRIGRHRGACLTPSGRKATLTGEHTFVPANDSEVSSMLTGRQQEIWKYLTDYVDAHGYPPTVREIGEAVGLASPSTVHAHLANLERAGLIKRDPTKPRALELRRDPKPQPASAAADHVHRLPLVGEIAAGGPLLADQNVEDYVAVPEPLARGGEEFLLRVKGDSMINAGILEGDIVVVRRQQTARTGEIVVALAGQDESADEATVKRFFRENGRVCLQPENDALEPIYAEHVQVLGVVTGVFRSL